MNPSKRDELLIRLDDHITEMRGKISEIHDVTLMHARRLIAIDTIQASHGTHLKWLTRLVTGFAASVTAAISAYFYRNH